MLTEFILFAESASVLADHTHFFPTETREFDRHAEERIFVLLIVSSKGVLVEQYQFRFIRARFRELKKPPSGRPALMAGSVSAQSAPRLNNHPCVNPRTYAGGLL
jgi:hypothetical protein